MSREGRALPAVLEWVFAALALLYAALVFHGIGPPGTAAVHWWEPRGFFDEYDLLLPFLETPVRALLFFSVPALLLAAATCLAGRSALARGLAFTAVFACLLYTFYGVQAPQVWKFFHWRGSAVMTLMAVFLGFAGAAPFLARSWLTLGWRLRLALYAPIVFAVIAFLRNATGTDESLRFAISPWPAIPVFGMEIGALFLFTGLVGVALATAGVVRARERGASRLVEAAALAAGMLAPVALLAAGSALSLLPFRLGPRLAVAVALGCGLVSLLAVSVRAGGDALRERARHVAVGAALIGTPLLWGQAWALLDYYLAREHRAREIIDALQAYYEKETVYPDELDELVARDLLDEIPEPGIGFDFLYDGRFRYRSFGTSFLLEFPAPRWVECAYTPPWEEEYDEDEDGRTDAEPDVAAANGDEALEEAWSCPSSPPELW